MAGAGRRSLSPRSASFKLQVDRHWWGRWPEGFPSAQHQPPSAASRSAGTGRKQSKCRHQRALLAPRDATRELRRGHRGISIPPLWGSHAGGFPEHHSVKLHHLQKIPWDWETAVCCLPASSPAGFPKCLVSVWLVLGLPGCVLLSWRLVRYLAGGRMEVPTDQQMVWEHWGSQSSSAFQLPCRAAGHFGFAVLGSSLFQKETCSQT